MAKEVITRCPKCGRECRDLPSDNQGLCLICTAHVFDLYFPSPSTRKVVTISDLKDLILIVIAVGFGIKGYSQDDFEKLWESLPEVK